MVAPPQTNTKFVDARRTEISVPLSFRDLDGAAAHVSPATQRKEITMDKWTILSNSKVVRVSASATTLVAVATIAGAGWKWN